MKKQNEITKLIEQAKVENITTSEISKLAEKALAITETISDENQKAEFLLEIGILFYEISEYSKSNELITKALPIFEKIQNKEKIIICFRYLGSLMMNPKKYEEAKEYFTLILNATSKDEMPYYYYHAKSSLGDIYSMLGNSNKALEYLFSALEYFTINNILLEETIALNSIFLLYINYEQPDKALEYGLKALKLCYKLPNKKRLLTKILNNLGFLYMKDRNFDLALDYYLRSLKIMENNKINVLIPMSLNNIGDVYELSGKFDLAFTYYKKAYDFAKDLEDDEVVTATTFNLGKGYLHKGKKKKAYFLFEESIDLMQKVKFSELQDQVYNEVKDIYYQNGDFEKAVESQEKLFVRREKWYSSKIDEKNFRINELIKDDKNFNNPNLEIIGNSEIITELTDILELISVHNVNVLITGATGTGKELFAQRIHQKYKEESPFVAINCAAIPDHLLESELFGYKKGAFTGANKSKKGRIEQANGGTLFLDEIGDLSFQLQSKILRVIQDRVIIHIGGTKPQPVEIRIISATNRDIKEMLKNRTFREDLYYRLNIMKIHIPPLKDRKLDIPLLTDYFLKSFNLKFNKKIRSISMEALNILMKYNWPGNVRELKNSLEKAILLCDADILNKELFFDLDKTEPLLESENGILSWKNFQMKKNEMIKKMENEYISNLLSLSGKNIYKASKLGNLGRTQIYRLLEKTGKCKLIIDD